MCHTHVKNADSTTNFEGNIGIKTIFRDREHKKIFDLEKNEQTKTAEYTNLFQENKGTDSPGRASI